ncbi:hypothetical protein NECAME_18566, partial [Necator americanus]
MANFLTSAWALRWIKRFVLFVLIAFVCIAGVRFYDAQRKAPLSLWHTYVPEDMHAHEIDHATWEEYIANENRLFDSVKKNVTDKLPAEERVPANRYFSGSPIYPGHFRTDWNRSYTLMPQGPPRGVAVMLHGLTDSPYSLRHIAQRYQKDGFAVVAVRLPGHGTVPSGLTEVTAEDWEAATRLA